MLVHWALWPFKRVGSELPLAKRFRSSATLFYNCVFVDVVFVNVSIVWILLVNSSGDTVAFTSVLKYVRSHPLQSSTKRQCFSLVECISKGKKQQGFHSGKLFLMA